jgi:hypothetical protein
MGPIIGFTTSSWRWGSPIGRVNLRAGQGSCSLHTVLPRQEIRASAWPDFPSCSIDSGPIIGTPFLISLVIIFFRYIGVKRNSGIWIKYIFKYLSYVEEMAEYVAKASESRNFSRV